MYLDIYLTLYIDHSHKSDELHLIHAIKVRKVLELVGDNIVYKLDLPFLTSHLIQIAFWLELERLSVPRLLDDESSRPLKGPKTELLLSWSLSIRQFESKFKFVINE